MTPQPTEPPTLAVELPDPHPDPHPAVLADFDRLGVDPRRGLLWAGAAPLAAGTGRLGVGAAGGWLLTWEGLQVAGGGSEVDLAWAPSRRIAIAATAAAGAGVVQRGGALVPAQGWGAVVSARWLVVDTPTARVAPFAAGGAGTAGSDLVAVVGGGIAVEVPFYEVVFDAAIPLGGVVVAGSLPDAIPLAPAPFAPLFLLSEAGFTWKLGPYTSFRLGYVALATSWSWRWHRGAWTVEVTGHTNVLSGNLSTRLGWAF